MKPRAAPGLPLGLKKFSSPKQTAPLIVEGAGGVMAPLNSTHFICDLIAQLQLPVILVTRSGLGTINHTLLSIKALQNANCQIKGLIINGPPTPHNTQALEEFGTYPILAEIPHLGEISRENLLTIKTKTIALNNN